MDDRQVLKNLEVDVAKAKQALSVLGGGQAVMLQKAIDIEVRRYAAQEAELTQKVEAALTAWKDQQAIVFHHTRGTGV